MQLLWRGVSGAQGRPTGGRGPSDSQHRCCPTAGPMGELASGETWVVQAAGELLFQPPERVCSSGLGAGVAGSWLSVAFVRLVPFLPHRPALRFPLGTTPFLLESPRWVCWSRCPALATRPDSHGPAEAAAGSESRPRSLRAACDFCRRTPPGPLQNPRFFREVPHSPRRFLWLATTDPRQTHLCSERPAPGTGVPASGAHTLHSGCLLLETRVPRLGMRFCLPDSGIGSSASWARPTAFQITCLCFSSPQPPRLPLGWRRPQHRPGLRQPVSGAAGAAWARGGWALLRARSLALPAGGWGDPPCRGWCHVSASPEPTPDSVLPRHPQGRLCPAVGRTRRSDEPRCFRQNRLPSALQRGYLFLTHLVMRLKVRKSS